MLEQAGPVRGVSAERELNCLRGYRSRTEGSGSSDDDGLVLDLLGQVDLVAGGVLD